MLKVIGGLWLFLILVSPWAKAQVPIYNPANKWEFSAFLGLTSLGNHTFATPIEGGGTTTVGLDSDSSYVAGARITENLGQHFGAELEYAYGNQPLTFSNLLSALPRLELDHKVHKLAYSILVYAGDRRKRLRPFGSIGLGTTFYQVSGDMEELALAQGVELRDRWKLALSYGGGAKVHLRSQWGFRVDFRDQVTRVPDFGLPSSAPVLPDEEVGAGLRPDGNFHNWQLTAGFIYSFGTR